MRACTTANAVFAGVVLAALTFAACGGSSTSSPPPGSGDSKTEGSPSSGASESTGDTGAGSETKSEPPKQPQTTADCKELKTDITNEPPSSAVPMNNATAPKEGSETSSRLQPLVDLIKANRDKFRCCFDLWARNQVGASGRVSIQLKIDPEGKLTNAEIAQADTTVAAPEVHACILDVARSLSYPKSPTGKETTYKHPFDFKARR
jgi:outer membrane biosynthesis protein TonB